jgi:DNA-binding MltR family transcriptional regulator
MMADSTKQPKFPEPKEEIRTVLLEETDRGCVLAAHGFLDDGLERLLRGRFLNQSKQAQDLVKKLFGDGPQPPLQSFKLKLVMARVLMLFDERSFDAMSKLNTLRVHFAHHPGRVTLNDDRVTAIYNELHPKCKADMREREASGKQTTAPGLSPARIRFINVILQLNAVIEFASTIVKIGHQAGIVTLDD